MRLLKNPLTDDYLILKKEVLSVDFPWYWNETTTENNLSNKTENSPHFGHTILKRPRNNGDQIKYLFPTITSSYSELCNRVLAQIFEANNIFVSCVYRISFNSTFPFSNKPIPLHQDHDFPHINLLIYLNNSGGETVCLNGQNEEVHHPSEDDIIIFEGPHYHFLPKKGRRVVLVATFM